MPDILSFDCDYVDGSTPALMPCINGRHLADLVAEFERKSGYDDPAGGYGGIVPSFHDLGRLPDYFLGLQEPVAGEGPAKIYTLFCGCGEADCWPLMADVCVEEERVIWRNFSQPHRQKRNYTGFGPFEFDRSAYQHTIEQTAPFSVVD